MNKLNAKKNGVCKISALINHNTMWVHMYVERLSSLDFFLPNRISVEQ